MDPRRLPTPPSSVSNASSCRDGDLSRCPRGTLHPDPESRVFQAGTCAQVGDGPVKVSTQPLRDHAVAQDASMRDQMQGMRLALTNALKELLQV